MGSRSRSRSRSPRDRVDRFGRSISNRPRSRSRSGSKTRQSHRRGRSPPRKFVRSRSRSPYRNSRGRVTDRTNIEDPEFLNARIFIGNLPSDKTSKQDLENLFQAYGKILGVSIHDRGFGFVQFEKEADARKAQEAENGTKLNGLVLDVKMAAEGRKQPGAGRGRGAPRGGHSDSGSGYERDRSPPPRREPPPPPPRDDPYYADPYRRPPPPDDPYRPPYRDDPYRRDPYRPPVYDDPYRDPYYRDPYLPPPPPKKPMPADVQILCMTKNLIGYAESIEARLRQSALIVDIVIIPEELQVAEMVEEAARHKFLFAIIINSQNEIHKSLTLNILHGTPQEHRNMPLEDALKLVASSFEKYIQAQREKVAAPAPTPAAATTAAPPIPFLPPPADVSYLLNLLADNRQLTIEELDKVIDYLTLRKQKLGGGEQIKPAEAVRAPATTGGVESTTAFLQQQQQELHSKILNILNGSNSSALPQATPQPVQAQPQYRGVAPTGVARAQPGASPLINFDNPNVKKALDSLIQNPTLLKSLPSSVSSSPQFSVATAGGPSRQPGYPPPQQQQQQQQTSPSAGGYGGGQYVGQPRAQAPPGYGVPGQRPAMVARSQQQMRPRF